MPYMVLFNLLLLSVRFSILDRRPSRDSYQGFPFYYSIVSYYFRFVQQIFVSRFLHNGFRDFMKLSGIVRNKNVREKKIIFWNFTSSRELRPIFCFSNDNSSGGFLLNACIKKFETFRKCRWWHLDVH
jgi:hypothetical protein